MAHNRQSARDRVQAHEDYKTNLDAKKEIEEIQTELSRVETDKIDKILALLEETRSNKDHSKNNNETRHKFGM